MKRILITLVIVLSAVFLKAQISQQEFDRYLNTYYRTHQVESVKAFFGGKTVDSIYLATLVELGGKQFYKLSEEVLANDFIDALSSKLSYNDWDTGRATIIASELQMADIFNVQELENDVWILFKAGLYPTPNVSIYRDKVQDILVQNGSKHIDISSQSPAVIDSILLQDLEGYHQFKAYLYWFYHLLAVEKGDALSTYLPRYIDRLEEDIFLTPEQRCFAYLAAGKFLNSLDYEKYYTQAIQLFSTAYLYHQQRNGSLDDGISIAAITAESINNLPGTEAKQRAFISIYKFYLENRLKLSLDHQMKCFVLLTKYGIEINESREFETGLKSRSLNLPLYNYVCYNYFSKNPGPYFWLTHVNIVKQMRADGRYKEMAHFALHAFEEGSDYQSIRNSKLVSFLISAFRLSDYYLNQSYSHSYDQFIQYIERLQRDGKIQESDLLRMKENIKDQRDLDNESRREKKSGDYKYFFNNIDLMEFLSEEDIEAFELLNFDNLAYSPIPFSSYYLNNIFKFLPENKFSGRGFSTPLETIRTIHRIYDLHSSPVAQVQYHLGYQLALSENDLEIHKKKLEVYELDQNKMQLQLLSGLLSDSITIQKNQIGSLNIQSLQKDSILSSKEVELADLNADVLEVKQDKTRIEAEKEKAKNELIITQDTVLFQQAALTIGAILLVYITILLFKVKAQKTREEILSWTNNQLSHFGKNIPTSIRIRLEHALKSKSQDIINNELKRLGRLSDFFTAFYKDSHSTRTTVEDEINLISEMVDIEYSRDIALNDASKKITPIQDKSIQTISIPKFTLFNLVYNSYKHGKVYENNGTVSILVNNNGIFNYFKIKDTGVGIQSNGEVSTGTGYHFVKKRIQSWNWFYPSRFKTKSSIQGHLVAFKLIRHL